jgi:hypothetical protein
VVVLLTLRRPSVSSGRDVTALGPVFAQQDPMEVVVDRVRHQRPQALRPAVRPGAHSVIPPDDIESRRDEHLRLRGLPATQAPDRYSDRRDDDMSDDESRRRVDTYKRKFSSHAERDAAKQAEEERHDQAYEEEIAALPAADRLSIRKLDRQPPDEAEREHILKELAEVATRIDFAHAHPEPPDKSGALCVFVPAEAEGNAQFNELRTAMALWGDRHTVLFTENSTLATIAEAMGINRAFVELGSWRAGHHRRVLRRWLLRDRGSTGKDQGRGELSLPLLYWVWLNKDTLFAHCSWFMKANTDTFINRQPLMDQLSELDCNEPYYFGTPLHFDSRGFNYSQPAMRIEYHLGGPGYALSRGFLEGLRIAECFQSMAVDPIWLVHDDVGVGYCATHFVAGMKLAESRITATATSTFALEGVLSLGGDSHVCLPCVQAFHPVEPFRMQDLSRSIRDWPAMPRLQLAERCTSRRCGIRLIEGTRPFVGREWGVPRDLQLRMKEWPRSNIAEDLV